MTAHVMAGDPDDVEKATAVMAKQSPLGRSGLPIDIAETALFFMTDAGSYISGQVIAVDAGLTAGASMASRWGSSAMVVARP